MSSDAFQALYCEFTLVPTGLTPHIQRALHRSARFFFLPPGIAFGNTRKQTDFWRKKSLSGP